MKKDTLSTEVEKAEKQALLEKHKTAMKKVQLINEIHSGLGEEIKKNAGKIKVIKKPWYYKFNTFLKKIFTKF